MSKSLSKVHSTRAILPALLMIFIANSAFGAANDACSPPAVTTAISDAELAKWRMSKNFVMVDTRPEQEYRDARALGSLNIPLFAVRTKSFLKSKLILLVGESYEIAALEKAALELKSQGFPQVKFLQGGLKYWKSVGGELVSLSPESIVRAEIPAPALAAELGKSDWKIFSIGCSDTDFKENYWPRIQQFKPLSTEGLKRDLTQRTSVAVVSCDTDPARAYQDIDKTLKNMFPSYLYYVKGGKTEMTRFAKQYQAILQGGIKTTTGRQCR